MLASLLSEVRQHASCTGLNLFGLVDAARFDSCQPKEMRVRAIWPKCGTLLVLGSGGRAFWEQFARTQPAARSMAPGAASGAWAGGGREFAADAFAAECASQLAARCTAHGLRTKVVCGMHSTRVGLPRLGEAAGFGTVSPVTGLLLHPEYGPWVRVRGAILCEGYPFGPVRDASIAERFQPCCACEKPCVAACPAGVHDGFGHHDLGRCAGHRHEGNCSTGCSSRAACPVGAQHRDEPGEDHRHAYPLPSLQRWFGLGLWRFVPRALRR